MARVDDPSIFQEALTQAQEILDELSVELEMELEPLYKMKLSQFRDFDLTPEVVDQLAEQAGHQPGEQQPCAACRLIAHKYGLE